MADDGIVRAGSRWPIYAISDTNSFTVEPSLEVRENLTCVVEAGSHLYMQ